MSQDNDNYEPRYFCVQCEKEVNEEDLIEIFDAPLSLHLCPRCTEWLIDDIVERYEAWEKRAIMRDTKAKEVVT